MASRVPSEAELKQALAELDAAEAKLKEAKACTRPITYSPRGQSHGWEKARPEMGRHIGIRRDVKNSPRRTRTSSPSPAIPAVQANSRRSARRCPSRLSKSASLSKTLSASRPVWLRAAKTVRRFPELLPHRPFAGADQERRLLPDVPAVLVGISSGTSYGALGTTHHSLHDLAVLRAINNLTIIVPADNFESRQAIPAALPKRRSRCSSVSAKPRCMASAQARNEVRRRKSHHAARRATTSRFI